MRGRPIRRLGILAALLLVGGSPGSADVVEGPDLLATMQVDRLVVEPGGLVTYWVRVDNLGSADAAHVRVTSHLPEHTSAGSEHCPDGTFEPDGDVCVHPEVPTPGAGDRAHQVAHSRSPLPAGEGFTLAFAVRVDEGTPHGTVLETHAHAAAAGGPEHTTVTVRTVVVGRVPRAVAGSHGVSLAGTVTTDSYDPNLGPYEASRSLTGGNLASNGDIRLSGAVVVNGDATPGTGGGVRLEGAAVVTGSTAPAAAPFPLADVDAQAYAADNANRLLCAREEDCTDAGFSEATKVLTVAGHALVRPGAYHVCGLDIRGRVEALGPVTFWMAPPAACPGLTGARFVSGARIGPRSGQSRELHLRLEGAGAGSIVDLTGRSGFTGVVDAPRGTVALGGGAAFFGGATAHEVVTGAGGVAIHVDRSLHPAP